MLALKEKLGFLKVKLQSLVRPKIFWLSIGILVIGCISLYVLKEKEKTLRICTEKELSKTVEAKKLVENSLNVAKKEIRIKDREISKKDQEIKLTLDKLEKEVSARLEIEANLVLVTKEKSGLEERVKELTVLAERTKLDDIVIQAAPGVTGRVLSWDKKHNFVVADLGKENNLKIGDILMAFRNDKFIGKVQIEKIEDKTSASTILPEWKNVEFKKDDVIRKI